MSSKAKNKVAEKSGETAAKIPINTLIKQKRHTSLTYKAIMRIEKPQKLEKALFREIHHDLCESDDPFPCFHAKVIALEHLQHN